MKVPVLIGPARGHRHDVDHFGRHSLGLALGRYEPDVTRFIRRSQGCLWDIGASTGYFSRIALRAGRVVVAFEPDTDSRGALEQIEGLIVRSEALGPTDTVGTLIRQEGLCARLEGLSQPLPNPQDREPVAVRRGDSLLHELPAPDVIKIDVEGAETGVLQGMPDILARHPAFAVECHSMPLLARCIDLLDGYDLTCTAGGDGDGPPVLFARARS